MNKFFLFFFTSILLGACKSDQAPLPILGRHEYNPTFKDGEMVIDTVFYRLPEFEFEGHTGNVIGTAQLNGKVHVADFFFTSCPTICPSMSRNMLEVSNEYLENDKVAFLSFTIDPRHDSIAVLKKYAEKLGTQNKNWYFLTGPKEEIFEMAEAYMVSAAEDPHAPGGLVHSGAFILVDSQSRIRAYYDGTVKEDLEKLKRDLDWLIENE